MSHTLSRTGATPCRRALATALAILAGGTAWAESDPYYIGASETITHDSNVVRLPDNQATPATIVSVADWIATTALFGGIDQPFGRQRAYVNLSVRDNYYRRNRTYSNVAYGLSGGLDWSTVERVSGNVRLSSNRTLASFDRGNTNSPVIVKNIEQTNQIGATVRVGVVTDLTFEGGFNHQNQRFSEVGAKLVQTQYNLGARYRTGGELTVGAGLRSTIGRYPNDGDSFKGYGVDLFADWVPSPISTVTARLGIGKTDHTSATALDFSGATGSLGWNWKPTGKLGFSTQLSRATGNESSFNSNEDPVLPVTAQSDVSRLTTTVGLNANYEATAKILLNAGYSRASRRLSSALVRNDGQSASETDADQLNRVTLGVRYQPTRTTELRCNLSRETRSADNNLLTYAYRANTVACAAQLTLQP